jgi:hypothetical protein
MGFAFLVSRNLVVNVHVILLFYVLFLRGVLVGIGMGMGKLAPPSGLRRGIEKKIKENKMGEMELES